MGGSAGYALVGAIVVGVAGFWAWAFGERLRRAWIAHRARLRMRQAEGAALEAALDDPCFSPERIRSAVTEMLDLATRYSQEQAHSATRKSPGARAGGGLVEAWARSRAAWLGNALELMSPPRIDLLRVVNRASDREDRAIVRVRCALRPGAANRFAARLTRWRRVHLDERWTLGRLRERWVLLSVDGDPLVGPVLSAPLIAGAWADEARLGEQSLLELAAGQVATPPLELTDPTAPAALALLDLSLVDPLFMPALIGATINHLVEAWEQASAGDEASLRNRASALAVGGLLLPPRPGYAARLLVRDAMLDRWDPQSLGSGSPATVDVSVTVTAVRYLVDDASGVPLAGNTTERHAMEMRWTLAAYGSTERSWQLVHTSDPAVEIPAIVRGPKAPEASGLPADLSVETRTFKCTAGRPMVEHVTAKVRSYCALQDLSCEVRRSPRLISVVLTFEVSGPRGALRVFQAYFKELNYSVGPPPPGP